jgi:DAPG hydrolase-like protein
MPYLGMRPGDLDGKSYAHHWRPEMAPLSAAVGEALLHGPEAGELGLRLDDCNRLLEPGYLPLENGWTRLSGGQVFVAVRTPMPGVSAAMIDWWFGWHGVEPQRYKLWHPRAHLDTRMERALADEPAVDDPTRWVGNTALVTEYIGDRLFRLAIRFRAPADYLDARRFATAGVGTAVCARTGLGTGPLDVGHLIHLIRATDDGCEMRSRFWIGDLQARFASAGNPVNRLLGNVTRVLSPPDGRDLVVHCAKEMAHLASFLPALYREQHGDARGGDG